MFQCVNRITLRGSPDYYGHCDYQEQNQQGQWYDVMPPGEIYIFRKFVNSRGKEKNWKKFGSANAIFSSRKNSLVESL